MTHEFKNIIRNCTHNQQKGFKSVLASVVALDGSSYRKPGVRMLIAEDGTMTGAVSGGCVEKDVLIRANAVFKDDKARMMSYDGRYRLGCEGVLYILIEPFHISEELQNRFQDNFQERRSFLLESWFNKSEGHSPGMGSMVIFRDGTTFSFSESFQKVTNPVLSVFRQDMKALFKVLIIGSEHDAVQMCSAASLLGWEVNVIASPKDPRTKNNFPGAEKLLHITPEEIKNLHIDSETAVILMNHNYATDLKFLLAMKEKNPVYIGLLGSTNRREKLLYELIEFHPEINDVFLDCLHGPAGLNIGAITPQEIAVSILAEILSIIRRKEATPLKGKQGKIHN